MPESYEVLEQPTRAEMVREALRQLEATRFEAELNATMSDEGWDVMVGAQETARQRVDRIDRQLGRLREQYANLLDD